MNVRMQYKFHSKDTPGAVKKRLLYNFSLIVDITL
jgi:hypothetical protein